ncbi:MAG: hypothetical protein DHS20C02_02780 [Micavibrio sp.]|nr:MAG: hypothetical protein DHS20C02_02780 [Micavibrio sp.]
MTLTPADAQAQRASGAPVLIDPFPKKVRDQVYTKPVRTRDIKANEITGSSYFKPTQTIVSAKVTELQSDLAKVQGNITGISGNLRNLERSGEGKAAEYYANIATINTQLQSGTTPGNPRLVQKIGAAERNLEDLSTDVARLNELAVDAARVASEASFLLENTRAAYSVSGAVEEDHVDLAQLEDSINNTLVLIERVLNNVNDDITRTTAYLGSERHNLRALALAVTNGDLYGKSLANRPFSSVTPFEPGASGQSTRSIPAPSISAGSSAALTPSPAQSSTGLTTARPLVKIRFDRPDVEYEQAVYMAVNEALDRYPNARFELVAVNPTQGNAAQVAIESTRARRNAERVLRTLTQMGLPLERIDLSYTDNPQATTNEVHLYIR